MTNLFSAFRKLVASRPATEEPTDPAELHDFLYQRGIALVQPYLALQDAPARSGVTAKARAELDKGLGDLERVLTLNEQNWAAAWFAGKAAQSLGEHERAYGYFARAFAQQNQNPDVARELMLTGLETGRAAEAVDVARHAVTLSPDDAGLKANLALAQLCAGDTAAANASIAAALQQDPTDKINETLQRIIGEVSRGERKPPRTPSDLE